MPKLIIDNIIIEKTDKDIQTGVKYELSGGINLICGSNEAGKSSLMKFIKEGLFRPVKTDTGKIFFSVISDKEKTSYRADIKNTNKKQDRCKLYDENDKLCDYFLIETLINRKYFEQGFTINLDDLMNLQYDNNTSLVNVIKDPSGDKLNACVQKIYSGISEYLGINNKPRKPVNDLLDKISVINSKINELSQKENEYNNAVMLIHSYEEEISRLCAKQDCLKILAALKSAKEELAGYSELYSHSIVEFNQKLFDNKEMCINILQDTGKFDSNSETIQRNKQKLENVILKLKNNMNRLNTDYCMQPSEDELADFVIDYEKINKIKELILRMDNNKTEIKAYEKTIENIEETLLRLKNNLDYIKQTNHQTHKIDELKELYSAINDGLKQYRFLSNEISNIEKNVKLNSGGILSNKNSMILFLILFLLTASCSVISFYMKETTAGIFSLLMTILIFIGFSIQKLGSYQDYQTNDKMRKQTQQEAILLNVIAKVKNYYPEIENIESSYIVEKLAELQQEINTKIISSSSLSDEINKTQSDINFNESKLDSINEKINGIQSENSDIKNEIQELIKSDNIKFSSDEKKYVEITGLIKNIKDEIFEKNAILTEIQDIENVNNEILKKFNTFIIENDININMSSSLKQNADSLTKYCERNNEIKKQTDILNVSIENLNKKVSQLEEEKSLFSCDFPDIDVSVDINEMLDETEIIKKEKQALKKDAEFKKRSLEDFEGITDLKNEKNILLNEYRNLVKNIFINKTVSSLTMIAKNNFDKTQPDLINAQKYLSILTDNKYSKINLETEEIISPDGAVIKKWDTLSRGTKEQLYLALRLGYASNYSKDKTTLESNGRADLPVIIDDAFVNFDYTRTHNALKCLIDFSKTNQVLFFTCHTDIIKQHLKELSLDEGENFKILYIK